MKIWKRNAIVATVLVLICAGVYLNWDSNQNAPIDFVETLNEEQLLSQSVPVSAENEGLDAEVISQAPSNEDYFAQIRLSRQQTRDTAVDLLQETISFEEGSESAVAAAASLDSLVGDALAESQVESLVIAKGYSDCVAYMGDEIISIAVSANEEGLGQSDVALISDIVTSQTDYELSDIRIIEVK